MMMGIVLAFLLHGSTEPGSLGIGIDVLPEAFSFAAGRVSYFPALRLAECDNHLCRWDLGEGVGMTAALSAGSLSVNRIEAGLEADKAASPHSVAQYRKACRAIVALVDPQASWSDQGSMAGSIAALEDHEIELNRSEAGYSFYGGVASASGTARCGAVASAAGAGPKL